jgi:hypothetical protein
MEHDLTKLLREWPYEEQNVIRKIQAEDGREVMQVRLPLGIEQYELDGRPDGVRPDGRESVLDAVEEDLAQHVEREGSAEGFEVEHETAQRLHAEGMLYYYRYLLLFQISDYSRVSRDTEHNLRLCRLLDQHCSNEEDRNAVLQFQPYIIRMNAVSRAMIAVNQQTKGVAKTILQSAVEEIEALEEIDTAAFRFERVRSVNYLKSTLEQIDAQALDTYEQLRTQLTEAVEEENYERAAELRDQLRNLQ